MDDLISRSKLIEFENNYFGGGIDCNDIARFPTIDAEPVVRCMECENSEPCPIAGVDYIYCNKWESIANKNGYCYCGAKMDLK